MRTLTCEICGDETKLEPEPAVSEAQIIAFVDAHYLHAEISIHLC
jgi:hypothetical protein